MNELEILTLTPLFAGLFLLLIYEVVPSSTKKQAVDLIKYANMGIAVLLFGLATQIGLDNDWLSTWSAGSFGAQGSYLLESEYTSLIPSIGVNWHVGIDALSYPMIWLTTLLIPISMLVQWDAKKGAQFHSLILLMEGALLGVFAVLDLFLFYVYWELTLVPMFFLILVWYKNQSFFCNMMFYFLSV